MHACHNYLIISAAVVDFAACLHAIQLSTFSAHVANWQTQVTSKLLMSAACIRWQTRYNELLV